MLNTTNNNNKTDININACSGGIYKTYQKSFFLRFNLKSPLSERLLSSEPKYEGYDVVVLQVIIVGDKELLAEIIREKDFINELNKE